MIHLTIYVDNIDAVISVFTHIRLYTSNEELGTYTHLAYITLVAGQSVYEYTHVDGTSETWYRSSYWSAAQESSLSDPVQGAEAQIFHYPTYPDEAGFSSSEETIIRKIRRFIGDLKGLGRLYIDGTDEYTLSSALQPDGYTIDLGEKGWPVYISLNEVEKTFLSDPVVQGYQHLTFSGTLSSDDIIDIWYYTFKFSNREIYEAYEDVMIPAGLTSANVTQDHLILQASIDLLENMASADIIEDGALIRDDQTVYDPSPGLAERDKTIKRLKAMLDDLVKQYKYDMSGLSGVLID